MKVLFFRVLKPVVMMVHFVRVLMPRWETEATMGDCQSYWWYIFQGIDATMGDCFAPLGPLLLPWDNRRGRGQIYPHTDIATTRPNRASGPIRWKCQGSRVTCHMSCVMCHMSHIVCHLSLTPTVSAKDHPSANSPIMHSRLVYKDPKTRQKKKAKNCENNKNPKMSRGMSILPIHDSRIFRLREAIN